MNAEDMSIMVSPDLFEGEDEVMSEEQFQDVQARRSSDSYIERGLNASGNCHRGFHENCIMVFCTCACHKNSEENK